jgi:hypothetical protein
MTGIGSKKTMRDAFAAAWLAAPGTRSLFSPLLSVGEQKANMIDWDTKKRSIFEAICPGDSGE